MGNTDGRPESNHQFDLIVQSRPCNGAHEEYAASQRVAEIGGQFVLFGDVKDIVDAGRYVIATHFVPPAKRKVFCFCNSREAGLGKLDGKDSRKIPIFSVVIWVETDVFSWIDVTSCVTQPHVVTVIG